ncbi:MAG: hypothetical protein EP329_06935 [Deltaproteobacteria bacterium]|nr:MAG: hypothetical protein EP329_06935 [Deltaproteobacteria bacterium]
MSRAFVDALLALAFPDGVAPWLDALVDRDLCGRLLADFKLNPVLPRDPGRPCRVALSDQGEPERWERLVLAAFPLRRTEVFAALSPPGARRMVDTDGETAELYLDDLQAVAHALPSPTADPLMCLTLTLPGGGRTSITRHGAPPLAAAPPALHDAIRRLPGGVWGLRWKRDAVVSAVWVSEARWRGDHVEKTAAFAAAFPAQPRFAEVRALAAAHALVAYPDAVELHVDGRVDLTVGFLA